MAAPSFLTRYRGRPRWVPDGPRVKHANPSATAKSTHHLILLDILLMVKFTLGAYFGGLPWPPASLSPGSAPEDLGGPGFRLLNRRLVACLHNH